MRPLIACVACLLILTGLAGAQSKQRGKSARSKASTPTAGVPKITKIDIAGLRDVLKPSGKPLVVNFWATWCDPCREEFPDLVKLDAEYKGRADVVTVSLDDPSHIATLVPKFLRSMKATMPAYLLHTPDESAAIALISKDWAGSLPFTVIYSADGAQAYLRMGKIRHEMLVAELEKLIAPTSVKTQP
jgi:thiol-disulfide isomerase/thioredoxin